MYNRSYKEINGTEKTNTTAAAKKTIKIIIIRSSKIFTLEEPIIHV